jgi:hypothetical protein
MSVVTPLKTAAEQALSAQFAAAKAELPGALPVRKLREDAFAGFEAKGRIVKSGGPELAHELEKDGYANYTEAA